MGLGEGIGIHQPVLVKSGDEGQEFFVFFRSRYISQFPVDDSQLLPCGIGEALVLHQHKRIAESIAEQGNLIIGVAVPVGILLFEGLQYIVELLIACRLLQVQVVHPLLVNPKIRIGSTLASHMGEGIYMAVRSRDILPSIPFVQQRRQVGGILSHQIL